MSNNTPILQLMKEYEEECCNFDDIRNLVKISLAYVDRMEDCQVRCLLFAMARRLDEEHELGILHPDYK